MTPHPAPRMTPQTQEGVAESRKAIEAGIHLLRSEGYQVSISDSENRAKSLSIIVWRLLQEAGDTLARTPDPDRIFLTAGERIAWPEVIHTAQERYEAELQRLTDAKMSKELTPLRRLPISDPTAMSRMFTVLGWLQYVRTRNFLRDRRLALELAMGVPPRKIRRKYGLCSENGPRMVRVRVVQHICAALKASCECADLVAS